MVTNIACNISDAAEAGVVNRPAIRARPMSISASTMNICMNIVTDSFGSIRLFINELTRGTSSLNA